MRDGAMNLFDFNYESTLNPFGAAIKKGEAGKSAPSPIGGGMMSPTVGSPSVLPANKTKAYSPSTIKDDLEYLTDEDITALINEGATDEEILSVAASIKKDAWMRDNEALKNKQEVVSPQLAQENVGAEEDGYLERLGKGLISAPAQVIESGASLLSRGAQSALESAGVKFKKEGEMGNLGEVVKAPTTSVKEDVMKMASGLAGTFIGVAAPIAYGASHAVTATEAGGAVVGALDAFAKNAARVGYAMVPGVNEWKESEQDALTEVMMNAFGAKSATPGKGKLGARRGVIEKLNVNPGTSLKNLGTVITNRFVKEFEPSYIVSKVRDYAGGVTNTKPQVIGETLNKYGVTGSVEKMSASAKRVADSIGETQLEPLFTNTKTKISGNSVLEKIKSEIDSAPELAKPSMRARYEEYVNAFKDKEFSVKDYNSQKSSLQNQTIEIDASSAYKKQLDNKLASIMRKDVIETVRKDTGKDISKPFDEYSQLKSISDAFDTIYKDVNAGGATASLSPSRLPLMRFTEGLTGLITPVATRAGAVIYRLGNGLELIGPMGIKTIVDLLNRADDIKVRNPEIILEPKLLPSPKTNYQNPTNINVSPIKVPKGGFNSPEITPKSVIRKPSTPVKPKPYKEPNYKTPLPRKKNIPKPKPMKI